ncbi:MAG TPA: allantoinase AllB [Symbiobacteriaceae bacterium]|nr:allantoinase AllB [Symbiobacteriaceae bacterium]
MLADLILRGGTVVTPRDSYTADVAVRGGKVVAVGDLSGLEAAAVYDATGLVVLPGVIDEHMHTRDPGAEHKEDFAHSTRSAAAGGVTTVLEMPNTVPPVIDAASFAAKAEYLAPKAFVDFGLWGLVLGDANRAHIAEMAQAGVVGYKLFWGYGLNPKTLALVYNFKPGDDVIMPPDEGQIYEMFETVAATGRLVSVHAENHSVITRLASRERDANPTSYEAFLRSRPPFTELMTINAGIELAGATGVHLHILHMSAHAGTVLVDRARARGVRVTGETCPHYLLLGAEDFGRVGIDMKVLPPIREQANAEELWAAVRAGRIQAIGSDHAPHTLAEKQGNIWAAPAGACGVQTMVPLMLNAVNEGRITLNQAAQLLSENPARLFGLYPRKGAIRVGADADFTVVDMKKEHVLTREELLSKNPMNPFHGIRVKGMPVAAFLRGRQIMQDGRPLGEPAGQLIRPTAPSDPLLG